MFCCNHRSTVRSILAVGKAQVCVQHHLMAVKAAVSSNVTALPLVLARIATHCQFRNPTLSQQGNIVIMVESSWILRIAPPTMIPWVAHLRAPQGVYSHQGSCFCPCQAHAFQEGLLHRRTASLRIRQPPHCKAAICGGGPAEPEAGPEIQRSSLWIGGQMVGPGWQHHSFSCNYKEIS